MSPFLTVIINAATGEFIAAVPEGSQVWNLDVPAPANLVGLAELQKALVPAIQAFNVGPTLNVVVLRLMVPTPPPAG